MSARVVLVLLLSMVVSLGLPAVAFAQVPTDVPLPTEIPTPSPTGEPTSEPTTEPTGVDQTPVGGVDTGSAPDEKGTPVVPLAIGGAMLAAGAAGAVVRWRTGS